MFHFDHIPEGKKPVQQENGEWVLKDLDKLDNEDVKILLSEKEAYITELESVIASMKIELEKYQSSGKKKPA